MNISQINQARELKAKLDKAQQELNDTIIEVKSGRGAVRVTINGQQKIQAIKISPDVINTDNANRLEDLVTEAVNEAIAKSQKTAAKRLGSLTKGFKIPGLT